MQCFIKYTVPVHYHIVTPLYGTFYRFANLFTWHARGLRSAIGYNHIILHSNIVKIDGRRNIFNDVRSACARVL